MSGHEDQAPESTSEPTSEARIAALRVEIEQAKGEVASMTTEDAVSNEIVSLGAGAVPAEVTRAQMAQARGRAMKKVGEIEALNKRLAAELEAQARAAKAEMEALMAPLRAQMRDMEEGLATVNLYLGRDEEILTLRDGAPAPADTPFTLRQQVLTMDEETAVAAESGGMDARNIEAFDEWILDPAHLEQVFPEPKGVVALVPRRRGRDYRDPWVNARMSEENRWTYFLLRNGDQIYRMRTEFVVGRNLMPATDEFTGLFVGRRFNHTTMREETYELVPGTKEWEEAEARQGARQRHFMRMALILQGLLDRTTVYQPLPPGGLNLLADRTYENGAAVLIRDGEAALTDGREDFYSWLRRLTHDLRPGMRILGAFDTKTFRETGGAEYPSQHNGYRGEPNRRITPAGAESPDSGTVYRLEGRRTYSGVQGWFFKYERTERRWIRDEWGREQLRAPKNRATCVVLPGDQFVIPFDLVTVEDMRYYLNSRSQRSAYIEMFPLLKAAIAAKQEEQATEAPFRDLLARTLLDADPNLETIEAATTTLGPLVDWWKFRNTFHRALNGEADHERRAIRDIVAEHLARTGVAAAQDGQADAEAAAVARLLAHDPTIMVIGRKRDGGYLAFAPQSRTYPAGKVGRRATNVDQPRPLSDAEVEALKAKTHWGLRDTKDPNAERQVPAAVADNVWAVEYTTGKTARSIKTREWVQPGTRLDPTRILHTTETWEGWDVHASANEHLTDPEIDAAIATLVPTVESLARTGWPSRFRNSDRRDAAFEPLILGVTLRMKPGMYEDNPVFKVHLIDAADPTELDEAPSAAERGTITARYGAVRVRFTKTTRGGVTLLDSDGSPLGVFGSDAHEGYDAHGEAPLGLDWQDRKGSTGSSPARPWAYVWEGVAREEIAVVEYPENGRVAAERESRVKAHNAVVEERQEAARQPLWVVKRAADRAREAAAYARFIEDYADPDLWEGHKKTLRDLETDLHPRGRGVPGFLTTALRTFVDEGRSFEGHTVRSLLAEMTPDLPDSDLELLDEYLDLPLWEEPEPEEAEEDEQPVEPEEVPEENDEDPGGFDEHGFDEHGVRTDDDGVVIVSGAAWTVTEAPSGPTGQGAAAALPVRTSSEATDRNGDQ